MRTSQLAVLMLCSVLALGAIGVGIVRATDGADPGDVAAVELRKDDTAADLTVQEDPPRDGDGGRSGDDDTSEGQTDSAPVARADGETPAPAAAQGDGDDTPGDDGTSGGENTFAPAPAPVPDASDDDSVSADVSSVSADGSFSDD